MKVPPELILFLWLFAHILVCLSTVEQKAMSQKTGENATLQCQASKDAHIMMIKWTRPDLKDEGYVYLRRGEQFNPLDQHPLFRGRVELKDQEIKNGEASVILIHVSINDTGTYKCYVGYGGEPELKSSINLTVSEPDPSPGRSEDGEIKDTNNSTKPSLIVSLSVLGGVVFGIVGYVIYKRRLRLRCQDLYPACQQELL